MKKLSSLVLTMFFAVVALFGQRDETLFGKEGLRLTGAWGGWSVGVSSFGEESVATRGGFGGVEFNKAVLVGLGGERAAGEVSFGTQGGKFKLNYGGLLLGFTPNSRKVVHPKFSFLMGGGEVKVKDGDNDEIFVVHPSGGAEINLFRWFRLGIEGGYRFVSGADVAGLADVDLSSYTVEVKFKFGWSWGK